MRMAVKSMNSWWVFWPALLIYVAMAALPASVWFRTESVHVSSVAFGTAPVVVENRTIRFGFVGRYSTTTRNAVTNLTANGCTGSEDIKYRGGLSGARTMSLVEWTAGKEGCARLPVGTYYTETCRTVLYPLLGLVPAKTQCSTSNIFEVTE